MFQKITRKNLELFLRRHATEKHVLDIGAGGSGYDRFFPNRVAIDIDPSRKPDIVADAHQLPFEEGEFEMVLCTEVLEHLKQPQVAINEMHRVLKPGGKLILTTRFIYPLHDVPHDYWRFTKYGLKELFQEWDIVELEAETSTFSTIGVLFQRIAFQSKLKLNKLVKLKLFFLAYIFDHLNFLLKEEYGDIKKSMSEEHIMPSGYYVVCKKK
jgi:SAM-dependent methyltransferase